MKILLSPERLSQRTAELEDFKDSAAEMYTGQQHQYLMVGLKQLREIHGQPVADLHIISAGYGLLSENDVIVPYNITFQNLKKKDILERSNNLQIHEQVETLIEDYDLVFYLLLNFGQFLDIALRWSARTSKPTVSIDILLRWSKDTPLSGGAGAIYKELTIPTFRCLLTPEA